MDGVLRNVTITKSVFLRKVLLTPGIRLIHSRLATTKYVYGDIAVIDTVSDGSL